MVPHYFKGEIYSPYQLLRTVSDPERAGRRRGIFLISETLAAGVRVYVASIPVKLMLGDKLMGFGTGDPILGSILLFVLLSLRNTYIGGVKAVIWTPCGLDCFCWVVSSCYFHSFAGRRRLRAPCSQRRPRLANCTGSTRLRPGACRFQIPAGFAVQLVDGNHRRNSAGDVHAWRGAVD